MPQLYIRGQSLAYAVKPVNFDRSLLALLFIHGTGGDSNDWCGQLEGLSSRATVIALELPGHGTSDPPGETSVRAYVEWVVDFIEEVGLKRVFVVGCSLGSAIAQMIALSPRPWLAGIGLVGTGARLRVHPAFLDGLRQDKEKALGMLADFCLSPATGNPLREEMRIKYLRADPELIYSDLIACNEFDVMEEIRQVDLPTWIIVGNDDKLTPPKYADYLHSAISGSRLSTISDAGHLVMMERPVEFNRQLAGFLVDVGLISLT